MPGIHFNFLIILVLAIVAAVAGRARGMLRAGSRWVRRYAAVGDRR
jgi:threonine/homoserine/homoserine lactone efflux protein